MKEFIINQYLSVRLERDETMIYVAGERFIQCKFLLLNIPISQINSFEEIDSIDEATEKIDEYMEDDFREAEIPPEIEFWGHCSNLQVWHEHGYDTRLIHSNLAFPLLKKLTEAGDPLARKVFKAEILKRYKNGTENTINYLTEEGFLEYLTSAEHLDVLLDTDNLIALIDLAEEVWPDKDPYSTIFDMIGERIKVENRKVIKLNLEKRNLTEFPKSILALRNLEHLSLSSNKIKEIPEEINFLLLNLKNLKVLYLGRNLISEIPEEINRLSSLRILSLSSNKLTRLPDSICELTSLEEIDLAINQIHILPKNIGKLGNLKKVSLRSNEITELPESFYNLKSLEDLSLSNNKFENLPDSFCKLKSLQRLSINNNLLSELPECFKNLQNIEFLNINKNLFTKKPEVIKELKKLNKKKRKARFI